MKVLIFFAFMFCAFGNEISNNALLAKMDETITQKKSCELREINACYEIAKKYEYGQVLRQSYKKAFEYYAKAISIDKAREKLAFFLHYGLGTKQDFNGAYKIYKTLCDMKYENACENSSLLHKIVVEKAAFDTLAYVQKLCDDKKGEYCYIVNRYLLSNNYKNKDFKKGWEFALKACLNGFDYACGVGFSELKMSEKEKFEFSKNKCEENSAFFCSKVADYYEYGVEGKGLDYQKNIEFNKKACALGEVHPCINVALKYNNAFYSNKGDLNEYLKKIDSAILIESKVCEFGKAFKEQDLDYVCGFIESSKNSKNQALNPQPKQEWKPPFTPLNKDEQIPLGDAPDESVASALIYYRQLAGIGENMICDDENSKECKEHLENECKDAGTKDDIEHCKYISLGWNSSFSGRQARYANTYIMTYLRDISKQNYDKNSFLYFLKYTKNLGVKAMDILAQFAGDDTGSENEAPFITWLIKNNSINQIKDIKEVFGANNSAEFMGFLGENNATKEMIEILTK